MEAFGFARGQIGILAELVEAALYRGDESKAKRHFAAYFGGVARNNEPRAAPKLRAEARLARAEGDAFRAHSLACDGLVLAHDAGGLMYAIDLLELVAMTLADLGHWTEAARCLGAAEHQRDVIGYVRPVPARHEMAPVLADIQAALGQDTFERALAEGRELALEDAVAYARRGRGSRSRASYGWESLTAAEERVASLVGQHLTNAEIARQLFISVPTVKSHLNRVFAKLGVSNREQLAAAAHRHDADRA